jgi:hypothetical protein
VGYTFSIPSLIYIPGTIGNAMEILNIAKKGLYMNTFEKFHIQKKICIYISKQGIHMNETYTDMNNLDDYHLLGDDTVWLL